MRTGRGAASKVAFAEGTEQSSLPRILVVDDELGGPDFLKDRPHFERVREGLLRRRRNFCERFGLAAEGEAEFGSGRKIARAVFESGLEWLGSRRCQLSRGAVLRRVEKELESHTDGLAMILLDVQFRYGEYDEGETAFQLLSSSFGIDDVLTGIRNRYGLDESNPGRRWTALPVVVASGMRKADFDSVVRERGARGMLSKWEGEDEDAREALARLLSSHGLLRDERGILVGKSLPLLNALAACRRAASGATSILVTGESGTGKELVARYVHDSSLRRQRPYAVFHAAGRGEDLQEDELFGHWQAAFTGASGDRPGLLEEANGGSLLVDEVGDLGARVQNALMRPLQERVSMRIGRPRDGRPSETPLDLLFVFATNKDLEALANEGRFKDDLLERIREVSVRLPALRERKDDIPLLTKALLARIDDEMAAAGGSALKHYVDDEALAALTEMDYRRGNVRELRNVLRRAVLGCATDPRITRSDVATQARGGAADALPASSPLPRTPMTTPSQAEALASLSRDLADLPAGEAKLRARLLSGVAPGIIVALLEASLTAVRLNGPYSTAALMRHFWGKETLTPQEARRALVRLLRAEAGGAVAEAANASSLLGSEPRLLEQVQRVAGRNGGGGG